MSTARRSRAGKLATQSEREQAREANRIHCKETRDRRRERERQLGEEVEILKLCKSIVEDGPDLFSLHKPSADAPFSYLCENFFSRLQLKPEDMLGRPLSSIVDERDLASVGSAILQVLEQGPATTPSADGSYGGGGGGRSSGSSGSLIHLRVTNGLASCDASMSIVLGSHGLIVVTRLYNS